MCIYSFHYSIQYMFLPVSVYGLSSFAGHCSWLVKFCQSVLMVFQVLPVSVHGLGIMVCS